MKNHPPPTADQLANDGLLTTRRFKIDGRSTALRIEQSYWGALNEICRREDMSAEDIIDDLARRLRQTVGREDPPLTSVALANAIRVFIVGYFRQAATETGHQQAGHGQGDYFTALSNRST
ncbi:MAG TPA: ribbon-helix-helix domain-containing protein [Azospirillaceae bacterium]|nr:ribbon-helix-helix domain-containing protein [Azospirillaceae bacterium]HRQ81569.1 ribbon-helix-helix domain-containing protein [Azospirillaceae bacterium]